MHRPKLATGPDIPAQGDGIRATLASYLLGHPYGGTKCGARDVRGEVEPAPEAVGERELVLRSWGFILLRDGYAPKRVTNTHC
jgi:hypothetical protein